MQLRHALPYLVGALLVAPLPAEPLPRLTALRLATPAPAAGLPCELTIDLTATFTDAFDPDQVAVDATVETPSRTYALPCFWHQPYTRDATGVRPVGPADWRLRFLPTEPGAHRVRVTVKDRTGSASAAPLVVNVASRAWPGLLRVAATNPLALAFEHGGAEPLIGFNVFGGLNPWGKPLRPDRIDADRRRIEQLAAAGGNFVRLRADSWWYALDNPPDPAAGFAGPARINQRAAWDLDALMTLCEQHQVQVMLCLENANATVNTPPADWRAAYNTYDRSRGGTVTTMADFWTDAPSKEAFRRKLRYLVARWGASPTLACWEFFNEVQLRSPAAAAWHADMAACLKGLDPHRRLVTTSGAGVETAVDRTLWQSPDLDLVQYHAYQYENTADLLDFCREHTARYGKPFIAGEFGTRSGERQRFDYAGDTDALMPHLGHWASALSGSPVAALDWYVARYDGNPRFYADFTHLKAFLSDVPYADATLRAVTPETSAATVPLAQPADVRLAPKQAFSKAPHAEFTVRPDGALDPPLETLNGFLFGLQAHPDLRNPPTFLVDYPQPGRFVLRVLEVVGVGANPIRITLDGATALEQDLPCELGAGKSSRRAMGRNVAVVYDRDLAIDVPAGPHRIGVDDLGTDRFSAVFMFERYARLARGELTAAALTHRRGAHLWLVNRSWSPELLSGLSAPRPASDVRTTFAGLRDGEATAEWLDPVTGRTLRRETIGVHGGRVVLAAGDVPRDLACRLTYR